MLRTLMAASLAAARLCSCAASLPAPSAAWHCGCAGWPAPARKQDDDGAYLRWWATDAEREDDVEIPSRNLLPGDDPGCPAYPFSVHAFANVLKWEGDIIVRP